MAVKKSGFKSLADQLADLEDPTPKDFDPEDEENGNQGSEDEPGSEVDENAGREHYEKVGKSKLRKPETLSLGKEYAGSRVSRNALEDGSDDENPFERVSDEDDDEDEEEDLEEEDDEEISGSEEVRLLISDPDKKALRQQIGDLKQENQDLEHANDELMAYKDDEELEENEDEDDISDDDEDDDASEDREENKESLSDERAELRRLMATDQKSVAATISQAAKADAAKGFAVKQQRVAFDALLNARIKLQKGFTAIINSSEISWETAEENTDAVKSAESAALALWSTLEELRLTLADVQTKEGDKKRKRPGPVSHATATESLWQRMQVLESDSQTHRRAVLEKWNHKVRGTNASLPNAKGKLIANADNSITAVLEAHVATELGERSTKKQRTAEPSDAVYDDTSFYQTLLRDLVEQRMSSSDAVTNGLDSLHLQIPTHPTSGMRKDKVRKDVDTKASKGRKMRYNVHEKLQNFMAPEDRGTWTDRARDEFFASLLGKTASGLLGEDEDEQMNGAASDEEDLEEGGLKLFRS